MRITSNTNGFSSASIKRTRNLSNSPSAIREIDQEIHIDIKEKSSHEQDTSRHANQQKKKPAIKSHSRFFLLPDTPENEKVNIIYSSETAVLKDLKKLILQTNIGNDLIDACEFLEERNQIKIALSMDSTGKCIFNEKDIMNTELVLETDGSLISMGATLIHELRHFADLFHTAKDMRTSYITVFDTEVNAFADSFRFFDELNRPNLKELLRLPENSKALLIASYYITYKGFRNFEAIKHTMDLLEKEGYDHDKLLNRVFPSIKAASKNHFNLFPATTNAIISSREFRAKS